MVTKVNPHKNYEWFVADCGRIERLRFTNSPRWRAGHVVPELLGSLGNCEKLQGRG